MGQLPWSAAATIILLCSPFCCFRALLSYHLHYNNTCICLSSREWQQANEMDLHNIDVYNHSSGGIIWFGQHTLLLDVILKTNHILEGILKRKVYILKYSAPFWIYKHKQWLVIHCTLHSLAWLLGKCSCYIMAVAATCLVIQFN